MKNWVTVPLENINDLKSENKKLNKELIKLKKEYDQYQKESVKWCAEDVLAQAKYRHTKLSKKAAQAILEKMIYKHDASEGICWTTIDCYIDMFKDDPSYFLKIIL